MTSDLKPYPHYKPSGVEWLGDVPAHWEVRRLKQAVTLMMGQSPPGSECSDKPIGLPFLQGCAEFGERHPSPVQFCRAPKKVSPMGAILLSVRAPVGRLNIADQEYGIGRGLCALLPHKRVLQTAFARYQLEVLEHGLRLASTGSTYDAVSVGDVGTQPLLVPPLAEQAAIVRYLDHTDGRIRRYLRSRERLIELLKEYRQATIHEAVTQGLEPDVPLKSSGAEWLGDIPAHWEVRRLKFSVENVADQTHKRRKREIYLAMEHVESWTGKYSEAGPDVVFDSRVKRFKAGDVLFGKLRPYLAKVTRPNRTGVCVGEFLVLRPRASTLSPGYLEYLMRSKPVIDAINSSTFGAKMPRADWQFIGGMVQPLPPLPEQAAIAAYLDKQTAAIAAAMARAQREIELLSEYRTRLIADVVTGQVDVREATRSLDDAIAEVPSFDESEQA